MISKNLVVTGSLLLLVFHALPAKHTLTSPASAAEDQPTYIGEALNPLAFGLPMTAIEQKEERTEKSATFQISPGHFAAVSTGRPMFTRDDAGFLVSIEQEGQQQSTFFIFDRLADGVRVTFDLTHPRYIYEQNGQWFELQFAASGTGVVENAATVAYRLSDTVTLRWEVVENRVEKRITIAAPGALPDLSFTVDSSSGLHTELADNAITLRDSADQIIFQFEKPFLTDENGHTLARPVGIAHVQNSFSYIYNTDGLHFPYILDPSSGPNDPGTLADDSAVGTVAWTNPGNAATDDGSYATSVNSSGDETTHYLKATNFGFSIPSSTTIDGIVVEVDRKGSFAAGGNNCKDSTVSLVKAGAVAGNNKATATNWPTDEEYATYGASNDVWGLSWTYNDINASNFGMVISSLMHNDL